VSAVIRSADPCEEGVTLLHVNHRLAPHPGSIVAGRRVIAQLPIDAGAKALAKLAASELITNSLEHSGLGQSDVIELRTEVAGERLRVSVCDPGPGPGRRMRPGLGLKVVERASDRWGVDRGAQLTCFWFEIDLAAAELGPGGDPQRGDRPAHGLAS
jgi:signal transduction histidine kinase